MADKRRIAQRGMYTVSISLFYGLFVPTHIRKNRPVVLCQKQRQQTFGVFLFFCNYATINPQHKLGHPGREEDLQASELPLPYIPNSPTILPIVFVKIPNEDGQQCRLFQPRWTKSIPRETSKLVSRCPTLF